MMLQKAVLHTERLFALLIPMGNYIWLLLLLLPGLVACRAQQINEKLKYQLVESILGELPPRLVYTKRGPDGRFYRHTSTVTDTPVVRLLLLDHAYSTDADYQIVLANEGTPERAQAMKYFSAADLAYMRQQLTASKLFKFEQAKIRKPSVTVIPLDTVMALNKRLRWGVGFLIGDSLLNRYGSDKTFAIWGILFSKDHKRALVNMGGNGWETRIYTKAGIAWRRKATLYMVEN